MSATQATCNGCVGRGTGTACCMCSLPIPVELRITANSPSEWDPSCSDCTQGKRHSHVAQRRSR